MLLKVFPRQLSGGHTHLYTEESILKMNEIIGIESIAEWSSEQMQWIYLEVF